MTQGEHHISCNRYVSRSTLIRQLFRRYLSRAASGTVNFEKYKVDFYWIYELTDILILQNNVGFECVNYFFYFDPFTLWIGLLPKHETCRFYLIFIFVKWFCEITSIWDSMKIYLGLVRVTIPSGYLMLINYFKDVIQLESWNPVHQNVGLIEKKYKDSKVLCQTFHHMCDMQYTR